MRARNLTYVPGHLSLCKMRASACLRRVQSDVFNESFHDLDEGFLKFQPAYFNSDFINFCKYALNYITVTVHLWFKLFLMLNNKRTKIVKQLHILRINSAR